MFDGNACLFFFSTGFVCLSDGKKEDLSLSDFLRFQKPKKRKRLFFFLVAAKYHNYIAVNVETVIKTTKI